MIDIVLKKDKTIRRTKHEDIYEGENKISWINVYLPETINDIDIKDYNIVLRCYINEDNYIPYTLDTTKPINKIDITHEFTDKDRYIDAYLYITRADEVIGKTNTVSFRVNKAKDGSGLTPREQFDEVIAEQRAEIAEQAETISTQGETITQQTERITELNDEIIEKDGQITELNTENTRLENLTDTQRETIQNMLDNPPTPKLETLLPINPTTEQATYRPSGENVGFNTFTVNAVDVIAMGFNPSYYKSGQSFAGYDGTLNADLNKWLSHDDTIPLFDIEIPSNNIIAYLCYKQHRMRRCVLSGHPTYIGTCAFQECFALEEMEIPDTVEYIKNDAFYDCKSLLTVVLPASLKTLGEYSFYDCTALQNVVFSQGLEIISYYAFCYCSSLMSLLLPKGLLTLGDYAVRQCSNLTTLFIPNTISSLAPTSFYMDYKLTNVTIENGFNCNNLNLSTSTLYSVETIVSWLEALADRTGETAYTLTMGTTNLNKLTNEQKAIAINKNWNLA